VGDPSAGGAVTSISGVERMKKIVEKKPEPGNLE